MNKIYGKYLVKNKFYQNRVLVVKMNNKFQYFGKN